MYLLVPLRPSRVLNTLYTLQCILALLALAWAAPPLWLRCVCLVGFVLEGGRYVLCARPSGLLMSDSTIQLSFKDRELPVQLDPHCFCNPYLIILRFAVMPAREGERARWGQAQRYNVIILPDSCPPRLHRQLRSALRWYRFDERVLLT